MFKSISPRISGLFSLVLALSLLSANAHAGNVSSTRTRATTNLTPDAIFKRYKDAVVRLEVTLHGASLGVGSGFFISKTGEIATSLHVIRPFLVHPDTELKVKLASGKVFSTAKIGACSDTRAIDLCLLKVDAAPSAVLPPVDTEVTPGETIVAIGHPRGLDFSISTGIVSALRNHPSGWSEVQIDAAISPGNSGGPIINHQGQAIGVVYQFERDGQNLNFGILMPEVRRLSETKAPYLAAAEARKSFLERSKRLASRAVDRWVKPAIQSFTDARTRPANTKWMRAGLGSSSFLFMLPDLFQSCEKTESDADAAAVSCSSSGGDLVLTIQKRTRSLEGPLSTYGDRRLVEARPLALVDRLQADGWWENAKTKKASFMSRPSLASCAPVVKRAITSSDGAQNISIRKKGFFQDASAICRFETENDAEPGAISTSLWVEMGHDFYGINVWASDPGRLPLLQALGDLAFASAGGASDDAAVSYRAKLRTSLRRDEKMPTTPIAGANLVDSYSDESSRVIIVRTAAVPPSQMNRAFAKWSSAIAKVPTLKPEGISMMEVAQNPGRLGTWIIPHPSDQRRNALFMISASFGPNDTWVLYELQPLTAGGLNRAPSQAVSSSITNDVDRFRSWTQDFEPAP